MSLCGVVKNAEESTKDFGRRKVATGVKAKKSLNA